MRKTARVIQRLLGRHFVEAGHSGIARLVLGSVPKQILVELFKGLTSGVGSYWYPSENLPVAVFLVTRFPAASTAGPSQECNWDFALAVRNSYTNVLYLVDPDVWDDRTYSIINATQTLGIPLPPISRTVPRLSKWNALYATVADLVAGETDSDGLVLESILQHALIELPNLEPRAQHELPWALLERVLELRQQSVVPTENDIALACGLLPSCTDSVNSAESRRVLARLARFLEVEGIEDGVAKLKETPRGTSLQQQLDSSIAQLRRTAGSATAFVRAPAFHSVEASSGSNAWSYTSYQDIQLMLSDVGFGGTNHRISLACTNALNEPVASEPFLVSGEASLIAEVSGGDYQQLELLRRSGRGSPVQLTSFTADQNPGTFVDSTQPPHTAPLTYLAALGADTRTSIKVVSLKCFAPGAFITCRGPIAAKVTTPRLDRASGNWQQQIDLKAGGTRVFSAHCGPNVSHLELDHPEVNGKVFPIEAGSASFEATLEDDAEFDIRVIDTNSQVVSEISLTIAIDQDELNSASSRFEALVYAHQRIEKSIAPARSTRPWLRNLESQLLHAKDSWRPVLATPGWSSPKQNLTDERILGDLKPQADPRQSLNPPANFVNARSEVVDWINLQRLPLPECDLSTSEAKSLAAKYLRAFRDWEAQQPEQACWVDTISILESAPEQYGNDKFAAHLPLAILVSPLHPIRFGWQVAAQHLLVKGLDVPCPLAGFLDPHRFHEQFALAVSRIGTQQPWRRFVGIPCEDSLWGLFWSVDKLSEIHQHDSIEEFSAAGVVSRGIHSGFSEPQATRTLEQIIHMLPTRSTLRIGILGSGRGGTSCAQGLAQWFRKQYSDDPSTVLGPNSIEVYDHRHCEARFTNEEIASLADDTQLRVRWFLGWPESIPVDLAIIDHLGFSDPVGVNLEWRSASSEGSLIRARLRSDSSEESWVSESRAGAEPRGGDNLLQELGAAVNQIESSTVRVAEFSHIAFSLSRPIVESALARGNYLAVSSSEIDAACFSQRSAEFGGVLWDFELPLGFGPGGHTDGFYLLAKPNDAIKRSIAATTNLINESEVNVDALLDETSRRGIPILKRLASGGTTARGELGLLLSVRLLQDVFRESPEDVFAPIHEQGQIRLILPVDPFSSVLNQIRKGLNAKKGGFDSALRPDLLLVRADLSPNRRPEIHLTPLEVKFREQQISSSERASAIKQAQNLAQVLGELFDSGSLNDTWSVCARGFLCEMLDFAFRVYGDSRVTRVDDDDWIRYHESCLHQVLANSAEITVDRDGRLLVFDASADTFAEDANGDGQLDTLVVSHTFSRELLSDAPQIAPIAKEFASVFHQWIGKRIPRENCQLAELETGETSTDSSATEPASQIPESLRERVRGCFTGFIGNRAATKTLTRAALTALMKDPPQLPASFLLTGNPSTGKTELARRLATALGLPLVSLDGRGLANRERLFDLINMRLLDYQKQPRRIGTQYQVPELEYPPLVVFIDEVHLVARSVQESLLTALEPKDRSVLLSDRLARLPNVTFLFATTRASDVDMAFRTRCTEVPLLDYTEGEVASIVELAHPTWPKSLATRIARLGRFVPRIALEIATDLTNESLVSEHENRDLNQHLDEVTYTRQIDRNGLGRNDIEYLQVLNEQLRPIGERHILNLLSNIDKSRFLDEVEPLLVARLGLVRRTANGREITPKGKQYLIDMAESVGQ